MFSELRTRKALVDTGNEVLKSVPVEWSVAPMRTLITKRTERDRLDLPLLSVAREKGVFVRSAGDDNHNVIPEDLTNYKVAKQGDLVINKMKAWQGSLGLAPQDGIVSPAYYVYDFAIENRYYGQALLRSKPYVALMGASSDGVRIGQWDLSVQRFRNLPVLVPPADEQAAIVKYLGHAHARIDRAIAAKRKLIALLEEQKQAIIHQAVTRGLDPTVPLKDSGIPWLGEIPAHWEVRPFKRQVRYQEGPGIMAADFRESGIPLIRIAGLRGSEVDLAGCNFLDPVKVDTKWAHFLTRPGDYLLSASASAGEVLKVSPGAVGAVPYTGLIRLWPARRDTDMEYLRLFMGTNPFRSQINHAKTGVGIEHFGPTHLGRMFTVVPPLAEQADISGHCVELAATVGLATSRLRSEIELLREFRTRLTSDVVTGHVDVREIAATLPELTDDMLASTGNDAGDSIEDIAEEFVEGESD